MADIADLIERFYSDIWQSGDEDAFQEVLHPDLRFRGSVGVEKRGREGFREYFQFISGAFGGYKCDILELIPNGDQAAAKMRFSGMHRRAFMGVTPERGADGFPHVSWKGAAFFKMRDDMLADIWVLGDVDGLRDALAQKLAPHQVDVFWSLQSPYCYFQNQRMQELAVQPHVDVNLKPVRPGVLRRPELYKDRSDLELEYFEADVARTAAYLDLPYAAPNPSPVEFKKGLWVAKTKQPRIDKVQRMLMVAVNEGKGLPFVDVLMHQIWSGNEKPWDTDPELDENLIYAGLDPAEVRKKIKRDAGALDAQVIQNEQDMYAAGHWGVPLTVYRGEAFYGQDRWDQVLWRIEENE